MELIMTATMATQTPCDNHTAYSHAVRSNHDECTSWKYQGNRRSYVVSLKDDKNQEPGYGQWRRKLAEKRRIKKMDLVVRILNEKGLDETKE